MKRLIGMLGVCALLLVNSLAQAADTGKERAEIRKASAKVLADLYKAKPSARKVVESAAGYATFTNFGMKLLVAGGGTGKGMAVRKGADGGRQEVFMKMAEVQAGLGIGIKKFKLVFVFDSPSAFDRFVSSGWEASAQATAAAKSENKGAASAGAIPMSEGIWLFQMTDRGLALEATIKGTKYYKDKDLN